MQQLTDLNAKYRKMSFNKSLGSFVIEQTQHNPAPQVLILKNMHYLTHLQERCIKRTNLRNYEGAGFGYEILTFKKRSFKFLSRLNF